MLIEEQTMTNVHAEPKPSVCELTEKELDHVSGGITVTKVFDAASPKLATSTKQVIPTEPC